MLSSVKFNYNQGHKIITPVCPVAIPVGLELSPYIPINLHKCLPCVLRSVHTRRQVAATRRGDKLLRVYRSGN